MGLGLRIEGMLGVREGFEIGDWQLGIGNLVEGAWTECWEVEGAVVGEGAVVLGTGQRE
jgi:hypothetical protein